MSQEATIRRGVRNARYTTVPNHVFEDDRLSMEARWLLGYLLSKPDDWTVRLNDIRKKGGCGRDKARAMVAELVKAGYAEKEPSRKDGKFNGLCLVIYDEPRAETAAALDSVASLPQPEKPATAKPSTVQPSPVNPPLVSTEGLAITESRSEKEARTREGKNRKSLDAAFDRAWRDWPAVTAGSRPEALAAWYDLSDDERVVARASVLRWLAAWKAEGRTYVPSFSRYLIEKRWVGLPDPSSEPEPPAVIEGKPWGPHWAGLCHREFLLVQPVPAPPPPSAFLRALLAEDSDAGHAERMRRQAEFGWPKVKRWHEAASNRRSIPVAGEDAWLADLTEFVLTTSPVFEAWRQEYERRGWPWIPDPGGMRGAYFPAGGPERLGEFEAMINRQKAEAAE